MPTFACTRALAFANFVREKPRRSRLAGFRAPDSLSVYSYNMLSKKLIPVGNSLGLVIDKPILDMLSITKDTELEIRTEGNALIIMPVRKGRDQGRENFFPPFLWVSQEHRGGRGRPSKEPGRPPFLPFPWMGWLIFRQVRGTPPGGRRAPPLCPPSTRGGGGPPQTFGCPGAVIGRHDQWPARTIGWSATNRSSLFAPVMHRRDAGLQVRRRDEVEVP